jgi:hypothetical protein
MAGMRFIELILDIFWRVVGNPCINRVTSELPVIQDLVNVDDS